MKALFELFRRFDARRIFGFIRRLGGMSRPKVKCYDLRSTRALRVEGDVAFFAHAYANRPISIHALRVEGDCTPLHACSQLPVFLSTPSGWRATRDIWDIRDAETISIHALRVEGDLVLCGSIAAGCDFYPRPPGGGRPGRFPYMGLMASISIHALRVEGDGGCRRGACRCAGHFYPRPPGGGRLNF